jgi:hypothetical protein
MSTCTDLLYRPRVVPSVGADVSAMLYGAENGYCHVLSFNVHAVGVQTTIIIQRRLTRKQYHYDYSCASIRKYKLINVTVSQAIS